jgi:hypothetical protein
MKIVLRTSDVFSLEQRNFQIQIFLQAFLRGLESSLIKLRKSEGEVADIQAAESMTEILESMRALEMDCESRSIEYAHYAL